MHIPTSEGFEGTVKKELVYKLGVKRWVVYMHASMCRAEDLFALEDMLVELLLQPFVGQVDAELLEAVLLEALETVDVQDAYGVLALLSLACKKHISQQITTAGTFLSRLYIPC